MNNLKDTSTHTHTHFTQNTHILLESINTLNEVLGYKTKTNYHQVPYVCLSSVLQCLLPVAMLMSMIYATTGGHVVVHSPADARVMLP